MQFLLEKNVENPSSDVELGNLGFRHHLE